MRLLTDEQWTRLVPCLPRSAGKAGRPFADHRRIVEGIIYRYRTGIPWRDLPRQAFGRWAGPDTDRGGEGPRTR